MVKRIFDVFLLVFAVLFMPATLFSAQESDKVSAASSAAAPAASPAPSAMAKDTVARVVEPPYATPKSPSLPPAALQKKKLSEEDILPEDEELLLPEKGVLAPVKKKGAAPASVQVTSDTGTALGSISVAPDSLQAAAVPAEGVDSGAIAATNVQAADSAGKIIAAPMPPAPVKIEEPRSINFAKNLKEYRSPKIAMLLSLLIPGLGQAYIKNYWKTGLYVAAEAAIIGVSVVFMNKGKDKYNEAKTLADGKEGFKYDKMVTYYDSLESYIKTMPGFDSDTAVKEKLNSIFGEDSFRMGNSNSEFSKMYNNNNPTQNYYESIDEKAYAQGWADCQPSISQIAAVNAGAELPDQPGYRYKYRVDTTAEYTYLVTASSKDNGPSPDDVNPQYGYSMNQSTFKTLMSQSNDNYKIATNVLFVILVNHVVSAVDALISANMYNNDLLGRQSFWHHIEVEPGVAGRDLASAPGMTLRVRF
jgi:hypothetical protein